ncbi:hypothetical protein WUBG_05606 [Wuchereria bancrofti]|uniref:Uncharacterized protein n=1 Tax=Wuchereria bancrofti TaxID=6293 RepID=J9EMR3_WUCBA|nr:hypothetical protein WUBG_05606 [Wuchereria bancrofti]
MWETNRNRQYPKRYVENKPEQSDASAVMVIADGGIQTAFYTLPSEELKKVDYKRMIRVRSHGGLYVLKECIPIKVNVGKSSQKSASVVLDATPYSKAKVQQLCLSIFQMIRLNSKVFDPLDLDSNITKNQNVRIKPYSLWIGAASMFSNCDL